MEDNTTVLWSSTLQTDVLTYFKSEKAEKALRILQSADTRTVLLLLMW